MRKIDIPSNKELEKNILGNLLLNNNVSDFLYMLNKNDFFEPIHKKIFEKILVFYSKNDEINYLSILDDFTEKESFYIMDLVDKIVPIYEHNIKQLKDLTQKRKLQKIGEDLLFNIKNKELNELMEILNNVELKEKQNLKSIDLVIKEFEEAISFGNTKQRLPFYNIDLEYDENELIIVAARPSVGKSLFAIDLVSRLLNEGKRIIYFSFEMSRLSLLGRLLKNRTLIKYLGSMTEEEKNLLEKEKEKLKEQDLLFFDDGMLNIYDLMNIVKSKNKASKIDFVIIDHLGLIQSNQKTRIDQVSEISRNLKLLAMQENIPILALSQLNRAIEHRTDKKPILADLRDSGSIEQDADKILFLYRENEENKESPVENIFIDVAKYRDGKLQKKLVSFHKAISKVYYTDIQE